MSSIIIVLPKIEDAKKIKKILMQHGFENIIPRYRCLCPYGNE